MNIKILILTILTINIINTEKTYKFRAVKKTLASDSPKSNGKDTTYTSDTLLVMADSPGQWQQKGIDPLTYPNALIKNMETLKNKSEESYTMFPKSLLMQSVKNTKEEGSSSVALLTIDNHNGVLRGVNIGSCEYIIYRRKSTKRNKKYRYTPRITSEPLMHEFNVPMQVGQNFDLAEKSVENELKIHGDELVVIFSDGVSANLFGYKIMQIINTAVKHSPDDIEAIADKIIEKSFKVSVDEGVDTPFSQRAKKNGIDYVGGRVDDISIIVAEVVEVEI